MQIARKVSIPYVGISRTVEKNDNSFQIHRMHKMGSEQYFLEWWKAPGQHGDLELLKWFRSDIQDGHS